jgi:thiol-disulfide isomerase/thioredoxin
MNAFLKHAAAAMACLPIMVAATAAVAATRILDERAFPSIRAHYAGKPFIVHIWGMTCGPCVAELPRWGALRRAYPESNLVLIQADKSSRPDAERRLREAGLAKVEQWTVVEEPDEFLRASVDPSWAGDMPRTLLIDASGKVERIRGTVDFDAIRRWLAANGEKAVPRP